MNELNEAIQAEFVRRGFRAVVNVYSGGEGAFDSVSVFGHINGCLYVARRQWKPGEIFGDACRRLALDPGNIVDEFEGQAVLAKIAEL